MKDPEDEEYCETCGQLMTTRMKDMDGTNLEEISGCVNPDCENYVGVEEEEELDTYCKDNDCEKPTCHRCFPRKDCEDHEKCREQGDYTE